MKKKQCPERNLPILKTSLPSLPAAKIPNWRHDIHNSSITQVNIIPLKTKLEIVKEIKNYRRLEMKDIAIQFSTIN